MATEVDGLSFPNTPGTTGQLIGLTAPGQLGWLDGGTGSGGDAVDQWDFPAGGTLSANGTYKLLGYLMLGGTIEQVVVRTENAAPGAAVALRQDGNALPGLANIALTAGGLVTVDTTAPLQAGDHPITMTVTGAPVTGLNLSIKVRRGA